MPFDHERPAQRARHHRHHVAGAPAAGAVDLDRRHQPVGRALDEQIAGDAAAAFAAQIEREVVAKALQPDAVAADRELRRGGNGGFVELGGRAERLHPAAAIELQPHAGHAPAIGPRGTGKEGEIEPRLGRPAVEVQPLRPGGRTRGDVGHTTEAVDRTKEIGRIRCGPGRRRTPHRPRRSTPETSGSRSARSRLGIPPRASTGDAPPSRTRYSVVSLHGDAARMRPASDGVCRAPDNSTRAAGNPLPGPLMTRSPPPTRPGERACSSTTSATPSRIAMTDTPVPNPAASTALRTGCANSDRIASLAITPAPR